MAFKDILLPDTLFEVCGSEACDVLSDTLTGQQVKSDHLSLTTPTSAKLKNRPPPPHFRSVSVSSETWFYWRHVPWPFLLDVSETESGGSEE